MFNWLFRSALSGGALTLANFGADSSFTDWSYDLASENLPFLQDMEDTAFGQFARDNWPLVAGGLAAYMAAPDNMKAVTGLAILGSLAYQIATQYFMGEHDNSVRADDPNSALAMGRSRRDEMLANLDVNALVETEEVAAQVAGQNIDLNNGVITDLGAREDDPELEQRIDLISE
ncbi:MAG: hypothetical protein AB8B83_09120 [Bdellovibrionales bacterium]